MVVSGNIFSKGYYMQKFLITGNNFFNKVFLWSILIFIGFCLGACSPRNHAINHGTQSIDSLAISQARIEYQNMIRFKAKNKAFYSQFKN